MFNINEGEVETVKNCNNSHRKAVFTDIDSLRCTKGHARLSHVVHLLSCCYFSFSSFIFFFVSAFFCSHWGQIVLRLNASHRKDMFPRWWPIWHLLMFHIFIIYCIALLEWTACLGRSMIGAGVRRFNDWLNKIDIDHNHGHVNVTSIWSILNIWLDLVELIVFI